MYIITLKLFILGSTEVLKLAVQLNIQFDGPLEFNQNQSVHFTEHIKLHWIYFGLESLKNMLETKQVCCS